MVVVALQLERIALVAKLLPMSAPPHAYDQSFQLLLVSAHQGDNALLNLFKLRVNFDLFTYNGGIFLNLFGLADKIFASFCI